MQESQSSLPSFSPRRCVLGGCRASLSRGVYTPIRLSHPRLPMPMPFFPHPMADPPADTCLPLVQNVTGHDFSCVASNAAKNKILGIIFLVINCGSMAIYVLLQKRFVFDKSPECKLDPHDLGRWTAYPITVTAYRCSEDRGEGKWEWGAAKTTGNTSDSQHSPPFRCSSGPPPAATFLEPYSWQRRPPSAMRLIWMRQNLSFHIRRLAAWHTRFWCHPPCAVRRVTARSSNV